MTGTDTISRTPRTWRKFHLYVVFGASLLAGISSAGTAGADDIRTAALPPPGGRFGGAELPSVLTIQDAQLYRRIFKVQEAGNWSAADRDIARLSDRLLMGQVMAQRYLHKNYRTTYVQLRDWLKTYGEEPDARAIHALALKRHPGGAPAPAPSQGLPDLRFDSGTDLDVRATSERPLTAAERERAYQYKVELRRIAEASPAKAEAMLQTAEARHLLSEADMDEVRGMIADAYLSPAQSRRLQVDAETGIGVDRPAAEFEAGLADWRQHRYGEARKHFEAAANAQGATPGQAAAAAFWAARTQLRTHHPELVNYWLGIAAQHPYSFYGLLARRTLGVESYFNFDLGAFTDADARTLMSVASGRRALALLQVGETQRAESELRGMALRGDANLMQALEALADRANLPALAFQLASYLAQSDGRNHDRSLFPVPRWTPKGGFSVDRALIFALMRQESQFLANVRSRAGATGVMQIMPATARSMASRLGLAAHDRESLGDPEVSLALAQEYLSVLLQSDKIGNNLILLAAAYNAGPGPIPRWLADEDVRNDPLLFLESIPSRQTRGYTERVLANYWIYRIRLGQPTTDLDALAAGSWPTYTALDPPSGQGGPYAAN